MAAIREHLHPLETGGSVSLKRYYKQKGVPGLWDAVRVRRLCKLMNLSEFELGAMFCVEHQHMRLWLKKDKFPPYVALHFSLLENWLAGQRIAKQEPTIKIP